jgi:tetratricopeptide (TPR) repeat protein
MCDWRAFPRSRKGAILAIVGLLAAVLAAYWPALRGGPLWDDDAHITIPDLQSARGLWRIWFELGATKQYYPVLHSAFWLQHRLWGDAMFGYHLTNILFHVVATILMAAILRRLGVMGFNLAALIFALHPVCVESVAWISEEKNTLSAVFYLSAVLVYLRFDEKRRIRIYGIAFILFILALLSKSVTSTLPAALLVIFSWKRGRLSWRSDVLPLVPWFVLGAGAGLFTAWIERHYIGAQGTAFDLTLPQRCLLAGRAIWFYATKLCFPFRLAFIYPRWELNAHDLWAYSGTVSIAAVFTVLWLFRGRARGTLAGILFYCGTLFPALGFFNVYPFIFSYVADHFQYLASFGIITLLAAGVTLGIYRLSSRTRWMGQTLLAFLVLALAAMSWRECLNYRDARTLYLTTLERNPNCWLAYTNLGVILATEGHLTEAIADYQRSLQIQPNYADTHYNLGNALSKKGLFREAIGEYVEAINLRPNDAAIHENLGVTLAAAGRTSEAVAQYLNALKLQPDYPDAHYNLANAMIRIGQLQEAIVHYRDGLRLNPTSSKAHNNLGIALARSGRPTEAVAEFEKAIKIAPSDSEAEFNLGFTFASMGRLPEAVEHYRVALRLKPDDANIHYSLGDALQGLGLLDEAKSQFNEADRLAARTPSK